MSRSKKSEPISLFAFQDAITSVCGVIVLITLLLAITLTRHALIDEQEYANAQTAKELSAEIEATRQKIKAASLPKPSDELLEEAVGLTKLEVEARFKTTQDKLEDAREEKERLERERVELEQLDDKTNELWKKNDELERQIQIAREEAEETRELADAQSDRGVFYEFPPSGSEAPWFLDISGERIVATSSKEEKRFSGSRDFLAWATTRPVDQEFFVLIARPSGVDSFVDIRKGLLTESYQIGVDLIGEARELEFISDEERDGQ